MIDSRFCIRDSKGLSMYRQSTALALFLALSMTVLAAGAVALPRCPEGRTLSGECVNPVLAQVQRHQAIIYAQPRISMTAPLTLPSEDNFYPVIQTINEPNTYIAPTTVVTTPITTGGITTGGITTGGITTGGITTSPTGARAGSVRFTPGSVVRRY